MLEGGQHFSEPVLPRVRKDVASLRASLTVSEAVEQIRQRIPSEGIIYFYVADEEERLVGVVSTRALLTAQPGQPLSEIMSRRVVSLHHTATIFDACELFVMHKFLAFPVVDEQQRIVGVVDVNLFTEEVLDLAEWEKMDELFEAIGFRVSQVRHASPWRAFRVRFPWLVPTVASGIFCALLASFFAVTIAESIVLAFFLTLVLGLGESVSMQSMTVTIQALRTMRPTLRWYATELRRELGTALLLGAACGGTVGLIVWAWRGDGLAGVVIGGSILLSLCSACLLGLSVPALLHARRLDPKIAAGPVTLALADIFTLLFYFTFAAVALG
ncbi:MAG: magnesium transporter [Verrucomicrobia bacterium]|nr:magnesium transporter [Verrucomicrobiota bacterium]